MVWTQALLWLIAGIIIGGYAFHLASNVGRRHARVVGLALCDDQRSPHIHFKVVGVTDKESPHEKGTVETYGIDDPHPPRGIMDLQFTYPITPSLRDALASCMSLLKPGRHLGRDYVEPFVIDYEGQRLVDIEMSIRGYTLNTLVDAKGIDELIGELLAAKEQILVTSPIAVTQTVEAAK
jgi:hypothetical protein